ncbi:MAG: hypothetical protein KBF63_17565 [Rhodoferax sp.]|jgi:hypothetical protein|nr:hypothetical protein [Rhodoferax sp.]MBP9931090.1 hypothetical protein [Rhodoferax sp.]HQX57666.1 hypothetical protein [Burkholderiaceae bacterium]HQZ04457.1 hypothetical protein [Burkholderiaceae bacterium]HRA62460.1 hypothetical protein [Burkholderiaceae bacterium]
MDRVPSHKAQSAAVLLPILGLFLLFPPFVTLFTGPQRFFGVPLIVIYIFGVWFAIVVATALVVRRLGPPGATGTPGEDSDSQA